MSAKIARFANMNLIKIMVRLMVMTMITRMRIARAVGKSATAVVALAVARLATVVRYTYLLRLL